LNSTAATVRVEVENPPVAHDNTYVTKPGQTITASPGGGFLGNDSGAFRPLSVASSTSPSHGILQINAGNGAFTYIPASGFHGIDSFTYVAKDTLGLRSNAATVTLIVD